MLLVVSFGPSLSFHLLRSECSVLTAADPPERQQLGQRDQHEHDQVERDTGGGSLGDRYIMSIPKKVACGGK
jgi:hypothetical protein